MKTAMMIDGTYPYGFGSVSAWSDQLIRGMPGSDFRPVAIAATEAEPVVWSLPDNVVGAARVLLWGPAPAAPAVSRRNGLPLALLREPIDALLDPSAESQPRFADVLREPHERNLAHHPQHPHQPQVSQLTMGGTIRQPSPVLIRR